MGHTNPQTYGEGLCMICVSEIEKLLKQIEELRFYMIKIKEGKTYTDPEVVAASQELDAILDKYQEIIM